MGGICVALVVLGVGGSGGSAAPTRYPVGGGSCSGQAPGCGSAQGTARSLAGFSWSAVAAPPLTSRFGQSSVWTGSELLVWGGVQENRSQTNANDGAAYDPATRSWTAMPASPLSPRNTAFTFWFEGKAYFWGGGNLSPVPLMDGASYDPAGGRWTTMPTSLLRADADGRQAVVWTGTQMVVVQPSGGAAFDPALDIWTGLPGLPTVAGWEPYAIRAEWTGSAVVTWVASRPPTVNGLTPSGYRFDTYSWSPGAGAWTSVPDEPAGTPTGQQDSSSPFGTAAIVGGRLLFLGGLDCPMGVSCPATDFYGGAWYDPASGTWSYLPANYSGGAGPAVWTGSAMVVFATKAGAETESSTSEPSNLPGRSSDTVKVGSAAAYDPSTGAWTDLARYPLSDLTAASLAWTGRQLIVVAMNGDTGGEPQAEVLS